MGVVSGTSDLGEGSDIVDLNSLVKEVTVGLSVVVLLELFERSEHLVSTEGLVIVDQTGIGDGTSVIEIVECRGPR